MVNEDRVEGAARNFGGRVQDAVGGMMGDTKTQAEGKINQAAGAAQNSIGSVMDSASEWTGAISDATKDKPIQSLLIALAVGYVLRALTHSRRRR